MAYGRLGWDEERFFNATPNYFFKALKGFNDLEEERQRGEWERVRMVGYWTLKPYMGKNTIFTPKKVLPLPWDKSFVEENKEILEQAKEIARKHGKAN